MAPLPLIGLSGYARSGKDTAALALLEHGWQRRSFADKLRTFAYALNPTVVHRGEAYRLAPLVDAYGWEHVKDTYPEARVILQRIGTDAGRAVLGENVWVDAVMGDVVGVPNVVFTDTRFPNEADALRERGGFLVRIHRPGVHPAAAPDGTIHPSETALDGYDFDFELVNGGTADDLHRAVLRMASERFGRTFAA